MPDPPGPGGFCGLCGQPTGAAGDHPECARARPYDPPRYCRRCGRRMVVQVLPTGWRGRCARHGERAG